MQYDKFIDMLLRRTSRSFYLTLHALPTSIRQPVAIGYLLARAMDTVADEINQSAAWKLSVLRMMRDMINSGPAMDQVSQFQQTVSFLTPGAPENILLVHFKQIVELEYKLNKEERADIIQVLNTIVTGQQLDIERFSGNGAKIVCLQKITDLDHYTYLVAGCVGEYWTNVCNRSLPDYSNLPLTTLYSFAVSFGKGLQLINILRDIPHDLAHGRCYLPLEQLELQDLNPECLNKEIHRLSPIVAYWLRVARDELRLGWKYMLSVKSLRVRWSLAMPLLLGFATLQLMQDGGYLTKQKPVKLNRNQVKILMLTAALGVVSKKWFFLGRFSALM